MSALSLKPEPTAAGDKQLVLPPLSAAVPRRGEMRPRRRFGVLRLMPTDLGFHPFRVN